MSRIRGAARADLLTETGAARGQAEAIGEGATLLHGFAAEEEAALVKAVERIAAKAPFRHMITPGGYEMSAEMTNCGEAGWISDRRGYRYEAIDPLTQRPWPTMPALFSALAARAAEAAGFADFKPDACLINRYAPGARLTLHQDRNERDFAQPIVSISLGLPAAFLFGGLGRKDRPRRFRLEHGDVVVWGGAARLVFHGIEKLAEGEHALTGRYRFNLTLRKAL